MSGDDLMTRDIERMRAMFELVRELTPAPPPPPPPPPDPIAQLRDLVEAVKLLTPAPAPPAVEVHTEPATPALPIDAPPFMMVLDRVAGVLEKMVDRQAAANAVAGAPPVSAEPSERVTIEPWLAPFIGYLPQLVALADAGQSAELVAQSIAAELSPEHIEALEPVLTHAGFPTSIIHLIPHLAQREAWALPFLYALRAAVLPAAVDVTDNDESETA